MKKISKAKIATTYANAIYAAALENQSIDKVFDDVKRLLPAMAAEKDFVMFMANPLIGESAKKNLLIAVMEKAKLAEETSRSLEVVFEKRRFGEITQILEAFIHLYYQKKDIVEVEVDSVKPLSAAQDKKLKANLEKSLGKKTVINYTVKPEVLGGLRVRFGSDMIDDTLAHKLNRLEIMMKGE